MSGDHTRVSFFSISVAVSLIASVPAMAQETVTLDVRFAHSVLAPGQSQQVEVWASFSPGIGTPVPWTTAPGQGQLVPVAGFGLAYFDVLNLANAETGGYSNLSLNPWLTLYNWIGTPQPNGNVTEIIAAQGPWVGTAQNPVQLWTATWTPHNYDPRSVSLQVHLRDSIYVLLGYTSLCVSQEWKGIETQGSFQIIPSPAALSLLAAAGLLAARRRRG